MCKNVHVMICFAYLIMYIGDGFVNCLDDVIFISLCLMKNLELDCDINFRLSRWGWYCVGV